MLYAKKAPGVRKWLLGFCLWSLTHVGWAQPAPRVAPLSGPVRLTPDLAARLAVERAPDRALAEQQVRLAEGKLLEAQALTGWQLGLQLSHTRTGPATSMQLPEEMGGGSVTFSPTQATVATAMASKPLFLGARDKYAREAARQGLEAARESTVTTDLNLALAARLNLYALLRLQQLSVVAQQRLTAVAEHVRLAQAMFDAGTVARFELVQAQTELERARGDHIRARSAVAQQQAELCQALSLAQGTELVVEEGVPPTRPAGDLSQLFALARGQRPEFRVVEHGVAAAEAGVRLASANDRMSVALNAEANRQTATAASAHTNWRATVVVSQPIFQGGQTKAQVRQAQAQLQAAKLELERLEQRVALQITNAVVAVDREQEMQPVAQQGVAEARERLRIAEVRFKSGVSLGVEVLDAQIALAQAEAAGVNARFDLQSAVAALRSAVGFLEVPKE